MKRKTGGVYIIRCMPTGWIYVGSAAFDTNDRWRAHRSFLRLGKHTNKRLQNDWLTYGSEAFRFRVVEPITVPKGCVNYFAVVGPREDAWISLALGKGRCYNRDRSLGSPKRDAMIGELKEMREKGWSYRQIADASGVPLGTIGKWLNPRERTDQ